MVRGANVSEVVGGSFLEHCYVSGAWRVIRKSADSHEQGLGSVERGYHSTGNHVSESSREHSLLGNCK